ncbi:MAG: hypothetical protein CMP23_04045 [Rickettsiales bacterium]|nr:hypothetical protein [Rickettsiales bacterium]
MAQAGDRIEPGLKLSDPAATGESILQGRVLFSSNLRGEFEPCSCPELPLGGISQTVGLVDSMRDSTTPVFWLDAGDRFFRIDMAQLSTEEAERRLRAMLLVDVGNLGGLDAMGVGQLDLGAGLKYLQLLSRRASFPLLSANLVDEEGALIFAPSVLLERGQLRLGVTSVLPGNLVGDGFRTLPPKTSLRRAIKALRAAGATHVVVLSNLGEVADRKLARGLRADLLLSSRSRRLSSVGEKLGRTVLGEAGSRGRYLGDARLYAQGRGAGPHIVLTAQPVLASGVSSPAIDELVEQVLRRLADPLLGVPPLPVERQKARGTLQLPALPGAR